MSGSGGHGQNTGGKGTGAGAGQEAQVAGPPGCSSADGCVLPMLSSPHGHAVGALDVAHSPHPLHAVVERVLQAVRGAAVQAGAAQAARHTSRHTGMTGSTGMGARTSKQGAWRG